MRCAGLLAVLAALSGCQVNVPPTAIATAPEASPAPVTSPVAEPTPTPAPAAYHPPRITPDEVVTRQKAGESFLIVDVRGVEPFKLSHVEGAVNHPWAQLQQADPGFPRDRYILLYCT